MFYKCWSSSMTSVITQLWDNFVSSLWTITRKFWSHFDNPRSQIEGRNTYYSMYSTFLTVLSGSVLFIRSNLLKRKDLCVSYLRLGVTTSCHYRWWWGVWRRRHGTTGTSRIVIVRLPTLKPVDVFRWTLTKMFHLLRKVRRTTGSFSSSSLHLVCHLL